MLRTSRSLVACLLTACVSYVPQSDLTPDASLTGPDAARSDSGDPSIRDACVPLTCESARANCGPVADGCGSIILRSGAASCGTCNNGLTCGAVQPGVCGSPALYAGTHSVADCVNGAGIQRGVGANDAGIAEGVCEFNVATCPTGWTRLADWGSTQPASGACMFSCRTPSSCTTGSHLFANKKDEQCSVDCYQTTTRGDCSNSNGSASATAKRVSVGCY
jgi:hypothetical protein